MLCTLCELGKSSAATALCLLPLQLPLLATFPPAISRPCSAEIWSEHTAQTRKAHSLSPSILPLPHAHTRTRPTHPQLDEGLIKRVEARELKRVMSSRKQRSRRERARTALDKHGDLIEEGEEVSSPRMPLPGAPRTIHTSTHISPYGGVGARGRGQEWGLCF